MSSDPRELGPQDLVVIAVKAPAHGVGGGLDRRPLLGPDTIVLPAMNGVPWWFTHGVPALGERAARSVDPGGAHRQAIPLQHVIGCVVHLARLDRGAGRRGAHGFGKGLIIGEPAARSSPRARDACTSCWPRPASTSTSTPTIRHDVWYKLWGNMTMNPVSALTGATSDRILDDPLVRGFCSAAMLEAAAIGARIGCPIEQTPEERHAVTRELGAFKTSMLQDVERGRPIELDALVTAVHEIGRADRRGDAVHRRAARA